MEEESTISLAQFERLEDAVNQIVRRQNAMQKTLDIINKDRDILEDILGSLRAFKDSLAFTRDHIDRRAQEMKGNVNEFGSKVQDTIGNLADNVETIAEHEIKAKKIKVSFWKKFSIRKFWRR